MSSDAPGPYDLDTTYIPGTLSEIYDLLASLVLGAPTFKDTTGFFPWCDIHLEFFELTEGFGKVRKKVGEESYAELMDLAARAKQLFLKDPEDSNGKTDEGLKLVHRIEDIVQAARRGRRKARLKDDEGGVTGD